MDPDDSMGGDEEELVDRHTQPGSPSTMTCPECHGSLWETREGALVHFRCRVGHAYTAESLLAHQADQLEAALWTALRSLEEHCGAEPPPGGPGQRPRSLPQRLGLHRTGDGRRAPRIHHPQRAVHGVERSGRYRGPGVSHRFVRSAMTDSTASDDFADSELGDGPRADAFSPDTEAGWTSLLNYLPDLPRLRLSRVQADHAGRRIRKRMEAVGDRLVRGLPGLSGGPPGRVRHAVQHHPHQRHQLLPRPGQPGMWSERGGSPNPGREGPGEPIRAWSAGCAPGEEAYTIAMVLAEELGADEFRERVKIYATDVDEDALERGTACRLHDRQVEGVPPELLTNTSRHLDGHLRLPQGPPAAGHLRPPRSPGQRRADLAGRPAGLPEHADVLQLGEPRLGSSPASTLP